MAAVVAPLDLPSLSAALKSAEAGYMEPLLVGPRRAIEDLATSADLDVTARAIVNVNSPGEAATEAAKLVAEGQAGMLVKGHISTDTLLKPILEYGLVGDNGRLSHVTIACLPAEIRSSPLFITDAGVNISPNLIQKAQILQNAIDIAAMLGYPQPRVAVLAAVETVNPEMEATIHAAALSKMSERGQIRGAIVDGPLALDNAVSAASTTCKHLDTSPVAGSADILLAPGIEAANILTKTLMTFCRAATPGLVIGATIPIALTSRADSVVSKCLSNRIASYMSRVRNSESSSYQPPGT